MEKIIIAIDGFSACGKSTTAKLLANILGYTYIDTGSMYRAVTYYLMQNSIEFTQTDIIKERLNNIIIDWKNNIDDNKPHTYLNGQDVEAEIRHPKVSEKVSEVSAIPIVRHYMVALQQKLGKRKAVILDGRDIGTNVFPDAELKLFMTADIWIRAHRRLLELKDRGIETTLDEVIKNIEHRDHLDSTRTEAPLRKASDAISVDTSNITIDEQIEIVFSIALSKITAVSQQKTSY